MNTGEFAAYCGVEKRTLFHYDQIGLLKPDKVLENGYREYTAQQAETMDTIKIMQASGYTLKEIKKVLNGNAEQRCTAIHNAENRLKEKMEKLSAMRNYIERKEELYCQYQTFRKEKKEYQIVTSYDDYSTGGMAPASHFFSFLNDGMNDTLIFTSDNQILLGSLLETTNKARRMLTFFMEIPSECPNLKEMIQHKVYGTRFNGDGRFFVNIIPHLYTGLKDKSIIRVSVFEKE